MSRTQILLFTLVTTAISLGLHAYVASRLLAGIQLTPRRRRIAWALTMVMAVTMPLVFRLMPFTGELWADLLQRLGWVIWGLFSLVFIFLVAVDLAVLLARVAGRASGRALWPADPGRRRFLRRILNLGALAAAGVVAGAGYVQARRLAAVRRVTVPIADLPEGLRGFRIAQISDLHVGPTIRDAEMSAVAEAVNELGADLIAVTGDLVDGTVDRLERFVAPLGQMRARHGTFFVTGNHEYFSGALPWCEHCREGLGWRVLNNEHAVIEHGGARVVVAGVTDPTAARFVPEHASDPARAIAGAPAADLRILLAHQPKSSAAATELGFHLQLSGHTHGGQYFPFTALIKLVVAFATGLQRVGAMWLYVNPGTTYWGPPLRLGAAQEITLLELERA